MSADSKLNYRDEIAEEIIRRIEAGTAPWQKPWAAGVLGAAPFNPVSGKPYRGINDLWLTMRGYADPRWLTYRQALEAGAQVRKGEKSTTIEYWQWTERQVVVDGTGKPVLDDAGRHQTREVRLDRPRVFYAKVFNAGQIDGLEPWSPPAPTFAPIPRAQELLLSSGVLIHHDQLDRAFYDPRRDDIHMPVREAFRGTAEYYATILHELGHATGHSTRLDRQFGPFGSEVYAREELRAEIASYMLARDIGISFDPRNHAAYVESWLKVLREDKNEIFRAARDAEIIKTWVMEPEKRQELEHSAQQLKARGAAPSAEVVKEPVSAGLSRADYGKMINEAMMMAKGPIGDHLPVLAGQFLGLGADALRVSELPKLLSDNQVPERDVRDLLERALIASEWPVRGAGAIGLADSLNEVVTLSRTLPHLQWDHESYQPSDRAAAANRIATAIQSSGALARKSALHAEWASMLWDRLCPVNRQAPEVRFEGYIPAAERQSQVIRDFSADPVTAAFRALAMPAEFKHAGGEVRMTSEPERPAGAAELVEARTWWNYQVDAIHEGAADPKEVEQELAELGPEPPPGLKIWVDKNGQRLNEAPAPDRIDGADRRTRHFIAVPFAEKNEAKALGAKWDRKEKSWYVPEGVDRSAFARWGANVPAPTLSPHEEFAEALKANGLIVTGEPIMDGQWHRTAVVGDHKGQFSGSYRAFLDGRPAGQITNYKAGGPVKWVAAGAALTDEERARIQAEAANVRAEREAVRHAQTEKAAKVAYGVWENLPGAATPQNCSYLAAKGVGAHGVKIDEHGHLVVPVRDAAGHLQTLQFFTPDGKRYIKEGQKAGGMHVVEATGKATLETLVSATGGPIIIAEGYATASSIFETTGRAVVAAFDSGNLQAVAEAVHARFPDRPILFAADNDHSNRNGNVGVKKAEEAAKAVGGHVVWPRFTVEEQEKGLTDFNDLHQARGKLAVQRHIESAIARFHDLERSIA